MIDNCYIKNRILESKDSKYREFHVKLLPNIDNIIGVRVPALRVIAKEVKPSDRDTYFSTLSLKLYEEKMVCGFVISSIKDIDELIDKVAMFVPYIDNWAVCDSFCCSLKIARKYPEKLLPFIVKSLKSDREYEVRFGIIMLLAHYINDDYIDNILNLLVDVNSDKYYISMALAWLLSVCYVKFPTKTERFLKLDVLDESTLKRYHQKRRDSFR